MQSMAEMISHRNERARKFDCHCIINGSGEYIITMAATRINKAPMAQRAVLVI